MNLSTEQKQTHGHREQPCGCQGGGSGMDREFGVLGVVDANQEFEWISNELNEYPISCGGA